MDSGPAPKGASRNDEGAPPQLRLQRRRQLPGSVSLGQVDHGVHRSGEFVDVTDIGEIPLRGAAEGLRRHAIKQDEAEIAVFPAGRGTGVELLPANMEDGV